MKAHGYSHAWWLTAGYIKPRNEAYSDTRNFHTDINQLPNYRNTLYF